jgi:hypothetical protein
LLIMIETHGLRKYCDIHVVLDDLDSNAAAGTLRSSPQLDTRGRKQLTTALW